MPNHWKKITSKIIYKTPWIKVRKDKVIRPDGKPGTYSYVETNGPSVMIVPITVNNEIYLIRQFRYTTQNDSWEVPGGNSEGENLLVSAKRELKEETGLLAKNWEMIGNFHPENGVVSETGYVFIAKDLLETGIDKKIEEGIFDMKKVSFEEVLSMVGNSEITDGNSIVAIFKTYLYLGI